VFTNSKEPKKASANKNTPRRKRIKMETINLDTFAHREGVLRGETCFLKISKNLHLSFEPKMRLAEGRS
jgi:hypothetical protein